MGGRFLQRLADIYSGTGCQPTQLVTDKGQQFIGGVGAPLVDGLQDKSDLGHEPAPTGVLFASANRAQWRRNNARHADYSMFAVNAGPGAAVTIISPTSSYWASQPTSSRF